MLISSFHMGLKKNYKHERTKKEEHNNNNRQTNKQGPYSSNKITRKNTIAISPVL